MEFTIIIGVFLCGLLAMVVELFIPGAVIGLIGFCAVAGSIILAFATGHNVTGTVLVVCVLAFVPVFFAIWKSVAGKYLALTTDQRDYRPSTTVDEALVGVEGVALTTLRPSGIARLNERRYDVVTEGEMIQKGTPVKVVDVSGNRIVVRAV